MPNFAAFLSFVLISSFTPGPNNIMAMSQASKYGFGKTLRFIFGVFAGFFAVILACTLLSATLLDALPAILPYVRIFGALFILYLAFKTVSDKGDHAHEAGSSSFVSGMLLQFVNPKGVVYSFTVTSTFIAPYYHSLLAQIVFSALLGAVGLASTACWALFGAVFERFLHRYAKIVNIVMAVLLVYCAVSLFL